MEKADKEKEKRLKEISTPALVVNRRIVERNCERMRRLAASRRVHLRPHVKTHKTLPATSLQLSSPSSPSPLSQGKICVSTIGEGRYYAEGGVGDILIAVPLNPSKLPLLLPLLSSSSIINLLIDHPAHFAPIEQFAACHSLSLPIFLSLNSGGDREGLEVMKEESYQLALKIHLSPHLSLRGVYTHGGHAYKQKTREGMERVREIEEESVKYFTDKFLADYLHLSPVEIRHLIQSHQFIVSIGSTPSLSRFGVDADKEELIGGNDDVIVESSLILPRGEERVSWVNEVHAGNYVFYDYTQYALGACSLSDCSSFVLSSIVSRSEERREVVIDGGALAMSKDVGPTHHLYAPQRPFSWGYVKEHPDVIIASITQELAVAKIPPHLSFDDFPIDRRLQIIPNHSCLTAACYEKYHVIDVDCEGDRNVDLDTPVVDIWHTCPRRWD